MSHPVLHVHHRGTADGQRPERVPEVVEDDGVLLDGLRPTAKRAANSVRLLRGALRDLPPDDVVDLEYLRLARVYPHLSSLTRTFPSMRKQNVVLQPVRREVPISADALAHRGARAGRAALRRVLFNTHFPR